MRVERFGEPWVLFRDAAGVPRMVHARCPHRGVDLGLGRVVDGTLACRYHGFRFGGDGRCVETPCELRERPIRKDLCVRTLPVAEHRGLLFADYGEPTDVRSEPALPAGSAADDRWASDAWMVWNVPYARVMDAMMDIHHAPHAHRPWLATVGSLLSPYTFERRGDVVYTEGALRAHGSDPEDAQLRMFVNASLPMCLHLGFSKRLEGVVCLCPIDDERTSVFIRYVARIPVVGKLVAALSLLAEVWLVQPMDRRMVEHVLPAPELTHQDKLVRADGGLALARKLLAEGAGALPRPVHPEHHGDHELRASHPRPASMRDEPAPPGARGSAG